MRTWKNIAVGVTVGVVLSGAVYVTAAPARPAVPARIGVVDFRRLLDNYDKMKEVEKEIVATQKALREEAARRSSAIQQLRARLAMHTPGSQAYNDTEKQITTRKVEFETWGKTRTRRLLDRERGIIREVYRDMEHAAANYAKANGFNLIIKTDKLDLTAPSVRELDFRVTLKKVLYAADHLDITDNLLIALNAEHHRQKAAARDLNRAGK